MNQRRCVRECGTILSRYNKGDVCAACETKDEVEIRISTAMLDAEIRGVLQRENKAHLAALRATPGHCERCGTKLRQPRGKQCDRCRRTCTCGRPKNIKSKRCIECKRAAGRKRFMCACGRPKGDARAKMCRHCWMEQAKGSAWGHSLRGRKTKSLPEGTIEWGQKTSRRAFAKSKVSRSRVEGTEGVGRPAHQTSRRAS